jgi:hypothetical protein
MAEQGLLVNAVAFVFSIVAAFGVFSPVFGDTAKRKQDIGAGREATPHYIGTWITGDGQIRHELTPGGRFRQASVMDEPVREGSYEVSEGKIAYTDDEGVSTNGVIKDGILYHSGMVFYRR